MFVFPQCSLNFNKMSVHSLFQPISAVLRTIIEVWCLTLTIFFRGHDRPLGVKRMMNTQNQRERTGRGGEIQNNKLVTACRIMFRDSEGFVFYFNKRSYSCSVASTRPAGKTDSPAKRRRNALCSTTLPLKCREGHSAPKAGWHMTPRPSGSLWLWLYDHYANFWLSFYFQ